MKSISRINSGSDLILSPKMSERNTFIPITVGSPTTPPKSNFFNENTLAFIGMIVSIIALAIALWAMNRNSDTMKRLTDINSTVVDLMVEHKEKAVYDEDRASNVGIRKGATMRDHTLNKFRRPLVNKIKKDAENAEKIIKQSMEAPYLNQQQFNTDQVRKELETQNRDLELQTQQALKKITNRKRFNFSEEINIAKPKNIKPLVPSAPFDLIENQLNKFETLLKVDSPPKTELGIFDKISNSDTNKLINDVEKLAAEFNSKPSPKTETVDEPQTEDDIDLDELERDLKLLEGK